MRPKLDKWYPLKTRFKVVRAHIKDERNSKADNQYRLVIEFPREHRSGWYPFELQLRDGGESHGLTNYWCNPFGEQEILDVIEAIRSLGIHEKQLGKLWVVESRYNRRKFLRDFPKPTTERSGK